MKERRVKKWGENAERVEERRKNRDPKRQKFERNFSEKIKFKERQREITKERLRKREKW